MDEKEEVQTKEESLKRGRKRAVIAIAVALAALFSFTAGWLGHWLSIGKKARSLLWAVNTAEEQYYKDVDTDALYGEFYSALSLDPYSRYYEKAAYARVLASNSGKGEDTGISLSSAEADGSLRVFRVSGNSPADRAGIRRGMYIHRFGASAETLASGNAADLTAFVAAQEGEFLLECGFEKDGSDAALYTVSSEAYTVSYCLYRDAEGAFRFTGKERREEDAPLEGLGDLAYIRIDEFYGTAAEEFASCLALMRERGKKGLVLDLRSNGGGYMSVFCKIAAYLMKDAEGKNPVAAVAKYKSGKEETYRAKGNFYGEYFSGDAAVYVLADERTASASECLIGALVSYGTTPYEHIFLRKEKEARTYGKGIMQSHFTDADGNVLKLTVAEIRWPNGKSIHGTGVCETDGAVAIAAPLLPGAEDAFLSAVLTRLP